MEAENSLGEVNYQTSSYELNNRYLSSKGKKKYLKFVNVIGGNEQSFKVECKICISDPSKKNKTPTIISQSLKNGGTCNIRRHLKSHVGVIEELEMKDEESNDLSPNQKFLNFLTEFAVKNAISFRALASPSFIKLVNFLNPTFVVPDRKTISRNVTSRYDELMNMIKSKLKKPNVVAGTLDIWSKNKKSFLGCTVHFLDPDTLQRENYTLSCRRIVGKHDYVNIGNSYHEILQEFDISDKMKYCSSDEAANMKKVFRVYGHEENEDLSKFLENIHQELDSEAYRNIADTYEGHQSAEDIIIAENDISLPKYSPCCCHKLSLIASTDALKFCETDKKFCAVFKSALGKLHQLWSKCKSTKFTDMIESRMGSQIKTPNTTRWLSLFKSIEDFLEKSNDGTKLEDIFKDAEVKLPYPNKNEMVCLKEYCEVMKPVHIALVMLEGEQNSFWAYVAPCIRMIEKKLSKINELQFCEKLKQGVLNGIEKRFLNYNSSENLSATALHPHFKKQYIVKNFPEVDWVCVENHMLFKMQRISESSNMSMEAPSKKARMTSAFYDSEDEDDISETSFNENAENLRSYLQCKIADDLKDLSQLLATEFEPVKNLFIDLNTRLPSSSSCERLFSTAKLNYNNLRCRLHDPKINEVIFVSSN